MSEAFIDRELSRRQFDGLDVSLWWAGGILTYVLVEDRKGHGERPARHRIDTPEGESPNDVYMHPFVFLSKTMVMDPDGHPRENSGGIEKAPGFKESDGKGNQ